MLKEPEMERVGSLEEQPRKVLLVLENLPVPHDRRMWQVATSLQRAGYHVSVISPRPPEDPDYCVLEGVHLYRYPMLPPTHSVGNFVKEALYCLWHTFRLSKRVEHEQGFDVFHVGNPLDIFWSIGLYYKARGKKFVYEHRDLCPELYEVRFKKRGLFYHLQVLFERWSYHLADMIIEMNESYRQNALERGKADPEKIVIVRSGPRASEFMPVEPDLSVKRGKKHLVCYLGIMGPQDGTDIFVKAAHHIVYTRGYRDVHFLAIGSGDCLEEVKQLAQQLNLNDYITFTGFVRERDLLLRYLSAADVGVASDPDNSYTARSTMNKIIEFMAVGVPIVATPSIENKWSAQDALISPPRRPPRIVRRRHLGTADGRRAPPLHEPIRSPAVSGLPQLGAQRAGATHGIRSAVLRSAAQRAVREVARVHELPPSLRLIRVHRWVRCVQDAPTPCPHPSPSPTAWERGAAR
jgi:glycosyltransferase involved in cell wall biosynthesis